MIYRSSRWLLTCVLFLPACSDHNSTGPSSGFKQIVVTGPESLAPGAKGQFIATGIRVSGPSEDLTSLVTWKTQSKSPNRVTIEPSPVIRFGSAPGEAQGLALGEATIQALYSAMSSEPRAVLVQPPGTFRLRGSASDYPAMVQSATVEIVSGGGAGMVTTTNYWGEFAFYGVSGIVTLQVSAPGYESTSRTVTVSGNRIENFELRPLVPPANIVGVWDFSIGVPSVCHGILVEPLRTRRQVATITQTGTSFELVTPLMLVARPPRVIGRLLGRDFTLGLPSYDDDIDHGYWDEPVETGMIVLAGTLTGTLDGDAVHGRFDGFVLYRPTAIAPFQQCSGSDGTFDLIRRTGSQ